MKALSYDHQAQHQAKTDLARGLCQGEVDRLTVDELDLLNQALQAAAVAAATARSIMEVACARFACAGCRAEQRGGRGAHTCERPASPWDTARDAEVVQAIEAHGRGELPADRSPTLAELRHELTRRDPRGLWLLEVRR